MIALLLWLQVETRPGVVYSGEQRMDVYLPAEGERLPGFVWIHGGGWRSGNRQNGRRYCETFAAEDWVCASIDYRLAPEHTWPAQIEDCRAAVAYLREHAEEFRLDPDRIVVGGGSAGGHLSLMLGLSETPGVVGVVDLFGPTDLRGSMSARGEGIVAQMLAGADPADASPITFVDEDDPPVLILHGDQDDLVPLAQSERLRDALDAAGVRVQLEVYEGEGHGLRRAGDQVMEDIRAFLRSLEP